MLVYLYSIAVLYLQRVAFLQGDGESAKLKVPSQPRDILCNQLIPAWYKVEKSNIIPDLSTVSRAALTSDSWTNISQDYFLTVSTHYVTETESVKSKSSLQSTGPVVAEEVCDMLQGIGINGGCHNFGNKKATIHELHSFGMKLKIFFYLNFDIFF